MRPRRHIPLLLALASLALAGGAARDAQADDDLEAFRLELDSWVAEMYQVSDLLDNRGYPESASFRRWVVQLDKFIPTTAPEELRALRKLFSDFPGIADAPGVLGRVLTRREEDRATESLCTSRSEQEYLLAKTGLMLVQLAAVAVQGTCDAFKCVDKLLTCPEQFLLCYLAHLLKQAASAIENLLNDDNNCALFERSELQSAFAEGTSGFLVAIDGDLQGRVIPLLDRPVSSRVSRTSVDALQTRVATDLLSLGGQVDAVAIDLADQLTNREQFQELDERLRIEESLQAGPIGNISSFELPSSLGGQLELVRDATAGAILMTEAAGENIYEALLLFNWADQRFNEGQFKAAYAMYRLAYRAAARADQQSEDWGQQ